MKMSEKFWFSVLVIFNLASISYIYHIWPDILEDSMTGPVLLAALLFAIIVCEVIWLCILAIENDWLGQFNEWLDKQDGDED